MGVYLFLANTFLRPTSFEIQHLKGLRHLKIIINI